MRKLAAGVASLCLAGMTPSASSADFIEQFLDKKDGYLDASNWLLNNAYGFLPVPVVISEPAIGYGLGFAPVFFHEAEKDKQARLEREATGEERQEGDFLTPRVSLGAFIATENGTKIGGGGHYGSYADDKYRYMGGLFLVDINTTFYDPTDQAWKFNIKGGFMLHQFLYRLADTKWFVGANHTLMSNDLKFNLGLGIPGLDDNIQDRFTTSGLGVIAKYDNVDNLFGPTLGLDAQAEYKWYNKSIGSDFNYSKFRFRSFYYKPLNETLYAGVRLDYRRADGSPPFWELPYIELPGIPALRYQGDSAAMGEGYLRWQFHSRYSLVAFGGVGRAFANGDAASVNQSQKARFAGGLGFRYNLARKLGIHSGIDVARGPEETVVYIKMGTGWQL
ncbi:BamA/TamA family outer membrane protein [Paraferrimonas sedimenticola]|uniref:Glyceraldehyde-3-phosphate dehydrogenase n=1 Tax=Paraferrimonas sedimenticola TaxID=375674 RepID=A0AA37RUZ4_9GAMM|nr:BamA/TamA family outer membrane protein [Paraferrimonas sedimenticola]GLP95658.1 glyceraldehyde-3-phosphate dehydrogenase [Paraferrimonas sedimenticola]